MLNCWHLILKPLDLYAPRERPAMIDGPDLNIISHSGRFSRLTIVATRCIADSMISPFLLLSRTCRYCYRATRIVAVTLLLLSSPAYAGVYLVSELPKHETLMPYSNWQFYLELAKSMGWKPTRTTKRDNPSWRGTYDSGGYCSSDGQFVSASDAKAIASALRKALADPSLRVISDSILASPQIKPFEPELADVLNSENLNEIIELLEIGGVYLE